MSSSYCTRTDIEQIFGARNVVQWADLDNNGIEADIATRVEAMIRIASNEINDRLRGGPYRVPVTQTCETLELLAARLAGVLLYEARGVQDFEADTGMPYHRLQWHRKEAERVLHEIRSGARRLGISTVRHQTSVPIVVKDL